ncbi:2OG-Fe(II) oxygenase family protein [Candidatus Parcubacteria bacterium]|nr:2OG-Fe(II) oxygenase family protein [Candidatus Parcubacteria bacterium]
MIMSVDLAAAGLINISYPLQIRDKVEQTVQSWKWFCELHSDIKKSFAYENEGNLDGAGYELKLDKGSTKDLKEDFHYNEKSFDRLRRTANDSKEPHAFSFIFDAKDLVQALTSFVSDFADGLEGLLDLRGFRQEVIDSRPNWILRSLHYFGDRQPGEMLATPHADKSGFTLHLFESHLGLEYLDMATRAWREMPMAEGQTVIISNQQLQYKTQGRLKGLCHRVIATEETAKVGRYSMVLFVPLLQTPKFDTRGKGRQQDLPPGWNYDISHEEFSQYFEPL